MTAEKREPGPLGKDTGSQRSDITTNQPKPTAQPRQCRCTRSRWPYAEDWRGVFRRGAVDALRLASRQLVDVDALAVLAALADEYELAGGDA